MPEQKHHLVYLASTAQGLELERYEIERHMARHHMINSGFAYLEDASPYDWSLVRQQIEKSDLFILLLGDDYGPMAPTGISYLHREFVHAKSLGKPVLAFIKNTLPEKNLTEEQRRLNGFHRIVTQQAPYKLWHLRDELMTHVKATLASQKLEGGWLPVTAPTVTTVPQVAEEIEQKPKLTVKQRLSRARQVVSLQIAAKVYEAGNLSREEVFLPVRLDQLLQGVLHLLRTGASEDRLRSQLESVISKSVSEQLLKRHPKAHAVDDVRISRGQFQQILKSWESLGLVNAEGNPGRSVWKVAELTGVS
ncbi:DUF4062 domain-containing protein [Bacterioplanoides pacificum]|uniref:DUF4062 domain-containing protein n=1 Tax=Bacterioplanoides pacificum TaxID=1171596 RepID=A0ABV7VTR1_9GAMM